jgi:transposase
MINVDDWAEIRRLYYAEHLGIKTIARQLDVARNTVRAAVRSTTAPRYERKAKGSVLTPSSRPSATCCGVARPCRRR